jgi:hypothetical protein
MAVYNIKDLSSANLALVVVKRINVKLIVQSVSRGAEHWLFSLLLAPGRSSPSFSMSSIDVLSLG